LKSHVAINIEVFDFVAHVAFGDPVPARLEAMIRTIFDDGCLQPVLFLIRSPSQYSVANVNLARDIFLTQAVVDEDEKPLCGHGASYLFCQFLPSFGTIFIATQVDRA
jgi:hypothetical protein